MLCKLLVVVLLGKIRRPGESTISSALLTLPLKGMELKVGQHE